MKQVTLIGLGLGPETLTAQARQALEEAELLFGAPRMLESVAFLQKPALPLYRGEEVAAAIQASEARRFAVLLSGDVGFYSGAVGLLLALSAYAPRLLPGVSSLAAFCARLGVPWQDVYCVSAHGAHCNLADAVRRNRRVFCLTGGNTRQLGESLCAAGFGALPVWAGEELGAAGERITRMTASKLSQAALSSLCVLLIENEGFDPRVRFGIPDGEFARTSIPMTKAEVRAVALSKLAPRPESVAWDVGCGSGSVSVELGLACYQGSVWALDKNPDALALTRENCRRFSLGNVTLIEGEAPAALAGLPAPDVVFLGGSGGRMRETVAAVRRANPRARLAITAIAIESVAAALGALAEAGYPEPELLQLSVARGRAAGGLHLMQGQNPIFLLSAGGERHD